MGEIIGRLNRERNFDYKVDKDGNIIKERYNFFKDPYTLVTIAVLILGGLYYLQMQQSVTNAENFDKSCNVYYNIRGDFILNNPDKEITVKNVLQYYSENKGELDLKFNLTTNE